MLTENQFLKRFEATKLVPNRYRFSHHQVQESLENSPYYREDHVGSWSTWSYSTMNAILNDEQDYNARQICLSNVYDLDKAYDFYKAAYSYSPNIIRSIFKPNTYIHTTIKNCHATKL